MSAKKISFRIAALFLGLAVVVCGCRPTGTSALLHGKKYLDRGNYDDAVTQFKIATSMLPTNAAAWNYYGVALQHAGKPIQAGNAYQRALELNRDFSEARLNLGTLWLDQNRPKDAKDVLTAYTLRWPNDPAGWLKLGSARLRLGETVPAERCFSAVIALKTNIAAAYNGLGLARIQRGKPREAAQFFAAALRLKPDFAAARLNFATVCHEYLHDDKVALQNYRAWLALKPRPGNWNEVNALVNELERTQVAAAPAAKPTTAPALTKPEPKPEPKPVAVAEAKPQPRPARPEPAHVLQSPRAHSANPPPVSHPVSHPVPHPAPAPVRSAPTETVRVAPEPAIVTSPRTASAQQQPAQPAPVAPAASPQKPAEKSGFWDRFFGSAKPGGASSNAGAGATPAQSAPAKPPKPKPVNIIPPTLVDFPRYHYLNPRPPAAGDRRAASAAFAKARQAEQSENWMAALNGYRQAAYLDPSWFAAQYNTGVIAQRLKDYSLALKSYEMALAIPTAKPAEASDVRYNFALALKAAGYVPDAVEELTKILAAHPREVRAHLALANLYAQQLHDPASARQHYLKVLELDPRNPEAGKIRFWLADNPAD